MATDGGVLTADQPHAVAAIRAGLLATMAWIGVASGIVLINGIGGLGLPAITLGVVIFLSVAPVLAIVGFTRALHGMDEWRRAAAVVVGVIVGGVALVALVLAVWSYLTFGAPGQ